MDISHDAGVGRAGEQAASAAGMVLLALASAQTSRPDAGQGGVCHRLAVTGRCACS